MNIVGANELVGLHASREEEDRRRGSSRERMEFPTGRSPPIRSNVKSDPTTGTRLESVDPRRSVSSVDGKGRV